MERLDREKETVFSDLSWASEVERRRARLLAGNGRSDGGRRKPAADKDAEVDPPAWSAEEETSTFPGSEARRKIFSAKISILDPEAEVLRDLANIFTLMGFEIQVLGQVIGASNLLREFKPDLLIVDITMPAISGAKLVQTIKQNLVPPPLIILHSALDSHTLARIAGQTGANDYVIKGGDYLNLITCVNSLLSHAKSG